MHAMNPVVVTCRKEYEDVDIVVEVPLAPSKCLTFGDESRSDASLSSTMTLSWDEFYAQYQMECGAARFSKQAAAVDLTSEWQSIRAALLALHPDKNETGSGGLPLQEALQRLRQYRAQAPGAARPPTQSSFEG
jgi:hypothetical protein